MRKALLFSLVLTFSGAASAAPEKANTSEKKAVKTVVKIDKNATTKVVVGKPAVQPAAPAAPVTPAAPKAAPATQPSPTPKAAEQPSVPGEPTTPAEVVDAAKKAVEYAKVKNWFGLSALCILILVWVLKAAGLFKKVGKRWAYIVVPVLGAVSMLLAKFVDGVSWDNAWIVATSAPCMALLSDFVKRGILGKEYDTPVNAAKDPLPPVKPQ